MFDWLLDKVIPGLIVTAIIPHLVQAWLGHVLQQPRKEVGRFERLAAAAKLRRAGREAGLRR